MEPVVHTSSPGERLWPLLLLALLAVCLGLFLNKAYHMDDTLFLAAADQILRDPWHPYAFAYNWFGSPTSMWQATQNPPLVSYLLAGLMALGLHTEPGQHLVFLLIACAAVLALYALARRLQPEPAALWTAAAMAVAPAFFVSATGLMADVPLLALLLPAGLLAAWNLHGYLEWGRLHTFAAASYSGSAARAGWLTSPALVFSFLGGTFGLTLVLPLFLPAAFGRRRLALAAALVVVAGILLWVFRLQPNQIPQRFLWPWAVMAVAGATGLLAGYERGTLRAAVGILHGVRPSEPVRLTLFLWLWLLATLGFAAFCNWTMSVRALLPALPPLLLLLARACTAAGVTSRAVPLARWGLVGGTLALSLWLAAADAQQAAAGRDVAAGLPAGLVPPGGRLFFAGHWGLQRYLEQRGALAVNYDTPDLDARDAVLLATINNTNVQPLPSHAWCVARIVVPNRWRVACMSRRAQAGFYGSAWGILPFQCSTHPVAEYLLMAARPVDHATRPP